MSCTMGKFKANWNSKIYSIAIIKEKLSTEHNLFARVNYLQSRLCYIPFIISESRKRSAIGFGSNINIHVGRTWCKLAKDTIFVRFRHLSKVQNCIRSRKLLISDFCVAFSLCFKTSPAAQAYNFSFGNEFNVEDNERAWKYHFHLKGSHQNSFWIIGQSNSEMAYSFAC